MRQLSLSMVFLAVCALSLPVQSHGQPSGFSYRRLPGSGGIAWRNHSPSPTAKQQYLRPVSPLRPTPPLQMLKPVKPLTPVAPSRQLRTITPLRPLTSSPPYRTPSSAGSSSTNAARHAMPQRN
jgi:hypothetical protein